MYVFMYVCMYVCMYSCFEAFMLPPPTDYELMQIGYTEEEARYVCMYVCMYVCTP